MFLRDQYSKKAKCCSLKAANRLYLATVGLVLLNRDELQLSHTRPSWY